MAIGGRVFADEAAGARVVPTSPFLIVIRLGVPEAAGVSHFGDSWLARRTTEVTERDREEGDKSGDFFTWVTRPNQQPLTDQLL